MTNASPASDPADRRARQSRLTAERLLQRALPAVPTAFGIGLLTLGDGHPVGLVSGLLLLVSGGGALVLSLEWLETPGCVWAVPLVPVALGAVVAAFFQISAALAVSQVLAGLAAGIASLVAFFRPMGQGKP